MAEPLIQVRFQCETCDGTGQVDPGPLAGGIVVQNTKLTCRACGGDGKREDKWVSAAEFRELFLSK